MPASTSPCRGTWVPTSPSACHSPRTSAIALTTPHDWNQKNILPRNHLGSMVEKPLISLSLFCLGLSWSGGIVTINQITTLQFAHPETKSESTSQVCANSKRKPWPYNGYISGASSKLFLLSTRHQKYARSKSILTCAFDLWTQCSTRANWNSSSYLTATPIEDIKYIQIPYGLR